MKTPTWGYVVGILMMLIGGCSAMRNAQYIAMPGIIEMQKTMMNGFSNNHFSKESDTTKILDYTSKKTPFAPSFSNKSTSGFNKMFSITENEKKILARIGYSGFIITVIYLLAGIFLLIRKSFSIKFAYCVLGFGIAFSIIRAIVLSTALSQTIFAFAAGFGEFFGIITDIILIVVIASSDKSAYQISNKNTTIISSE